MQIAPRPVHAARRGVRDLQQVPHYLRELIIEVLSLLEDKGNQASDLLLNILWLSCSCSLQPTYQVRQAQTAAHDWLPPHDLPHLAALWQWQRSLWLRPALALHWLRTAGP